MSLNYGYSIPLFLEISLKPVIQISCLYTSCISMVIVFHSYTLWLDVWTGSWVTFSHSRVNQLCGNWTPTSITMLGSKTLIFLMRMLGTFYTLNQNIMLFQWSTCIIFNDSCLKSPLTSCFPALLCQQLLQLSMNFGCLLFFIPMNLSISEGYVEMRAENA